jgi:NADH dehydrogenase [ubiquinone] 1 alpha subcomplex assembly factor 7
MSLNSRLAELIAAQGPISVAQFMTVALLDPKEGYYATRDPFGAGGDFTTGPEISQMFGEMVGLWLVQAWADQGCPKNPRLVELGPGRGTLMADILRTARVAPEFLLDWKPRRKAGSMKHRLPGRRSPKTLPAPSRRAAAPA